MTVKRIIKTKIFLLLTLLGSYLFEDNKDKFKNNSFQEDDNNIKEESKFKITKIINYNFCNEINKYKQNEYKFKLGLNQPMNINNMVLLESFFHVKLISEKHIIIGNCTWTSLECKIKTENLIEGKYIIYINQTTFNNQIIKETYLKNYPILFTYKHYNKPYKITNNILYNDNMDYSLLYIFYKENLDLNYKEKIIINNDTEITCYRDKNEQNLEKCLINKENLYNKNSFFIRFHNPCNTLIEEKEIKIIKGNEIINIDEENKKEKNKCTNGNKYKFFNIKLTKNIKKLQNENLKLISKNYDSEIKTFCIINNGEIKCIIEKEIKNEDEYFLYSFDSIIDSNKSVLNPFKLFLFKHNKKYSKPLNNSIEININWNEFNNRNNNNIINFKIEYEDELKEIPNVIIENKKINCLINQDKISLTCSLFIFDYLYNNEFIPQIYNGYVENSCGEKEINIKIISLYQENKNNKVIINEISKYKYNCDTFLNTSLKFELLFSNENKDLNFEIKNIEIILQNLNKKNSYKCLCSKPFFSEVLKCKTISIITVSGYYYPELPKKLYINDSLYIDPFKLNEDLFFISKNKNPTFSNLFYFTTENYSDIINCTSSQKNNDLIKCLLNKNEFNNHNKTIQKTINLNIINVCSIYKNKRRLYPAEKRKDLEIQEDDSFDKIFDEEIFNAENDTSSEFPEEATSSIIEGRSSQIIVSNQDKKPINTNNILITNNEEINVISPEISINSENINTKVNKIQTKEFQTLDNKDFITQFKEGTTLQIKTKDYKTKIRTSDYFSKAESTTENFKTKSFPETTSNKIQTIEEPNKEVTIERTTYFQPTIESTNKIIQTIEEINSYSSIVEPTSNEKTTNYNPTFEGSIKYLPTFESTIKITKQIEETPSIIPSIESTSNIINSPVVSPSTESTSNNLITPDISPSIQITSNNIMTPDISPSNQITDNIASPVISPSLQNTIKEAQTMEITPSINQSIEPSIKISPTVKVTQGISPSVQSSVNLPQTLERTPFISPSIQPSININPTMEITQPKVNTLQASSNVENTPEISPEKIQTQKITKVIQNTQVHTSNLILTQKISQKVEFSQNIASTSSKITKSKEIEPPEPTQSQSSEEQKEVTPTPAVENSESSSLAGWLVILIVIGSILLLLIVFFIYHYIRKQKIEKSYRDFIQESQPFPISERSSSANRESKDFINVLETAF